MTNIDMMIIMTTTITIIMILMMAHYPHLHHFMLRYHHIHHHLRDSCLPICRAPLRFVSKLNANILMIILVHMSVVRQHQVVAAPLPLRLLELHPRLNHQVIVTAMVTLENQNHHHYHQWRMVMIHPQILLVAVKHVQHGKNY
jgi:hypothetical protein